MYAKASFALLLILLGAGFDLNWTNNLGPGQSESEALTFWRRAKNIVFQRLDCLFSTLKCFSTC